MNFNGDVVSIELTFENCETININRENILWAHIGGEHKDIRRYSNSLSMDDCLQQFGIAIRKSFLNEQTTFGSTLANRLSMRDVTHVTFYDNENGYISYSIDWLDIDIEQTNGQYSSSQRVQFTPNGNLIFISTVTSMIKVDPDDIDDKEDWVY